jgi:ketosteroid isomerase-like protein
MTQTTEQETRQMIAVINTRNVDKVVEHYAENATFQVPRMDSPIQGKNAIRAYYTGNFAAFPDWTIEPSEVFVSGTSTIVVNSVRGTQTGPLTSQNGKYTIAPTNRKVSQDLVTRLVFNEHGKVQSLRAYGNPSELDLQLGLAK